MTIYRFQPHDMPTSLGAAWYLLEATKLLFLIGFFLLGWHLTPSYSREGGDWSKVDPEVREWIQTLKRPDYPGYSCCGPADAYEADLGFVEDGQNYAIITGTRGNPLPVGTKLLIPPEKVQNTQGNPSGHVIIFANEHGDVFCLIPMGDV